MTDAPQTPGRAPESNLDHIAGLHRMSRTAGLGSSEYSAVNVAAVVAVLIGAASGLALVSPVFLFLPVVGVVIAGVAIRQIASSNGTQTGLPLAVLALLLSIGLSGFTGLKAYRAAALERRDNAALDDLAGRFGKLLAEKKFDEAYALTDARFREEVSAPAFTSVIESLSSPTAFGPLQNIRSNKIFAIEADPDTGLRMAVGYAFLDFEKAHGDNAFRTEFRYRFSDEQWKVFTIPKLFEKAAPAAANAPAGAAGPPSPR